MFNRFFQALGKRDEFYYVLMAADGVWSRPLPPSKMPPADLVGDHRVS